jgi:hypothetical protein
MEIAIDADWSRRKRKHVGFRRLISALYIHQMSSQDLLAR